MEGYNHDIEHYEEKWNLEYNPRSKGFHYNSKPHVHLPETHGWHTIAEKISQSNCDDFCNMIEEQYGGVPEMDPQKMKDLYKEFLGLNIKL